MVDTVSKSPAVVVSVRPLGSSDMASSAAVENGESSIPTKRNEREEDRYGFFVEDEEQPN